MYNDWRDYPIYIREDGTTYIVTHEGDIYAVPNEGEWIDGTAPVQWSEVYAWAIAHPEQIQPEPVDPTPIPTPEENIQSFNYIIEQRFTEFANIRAYASISEALSQRTDFSHDAVQAQDAWDLMENAAEPLRQQLLAQTITLEQAVASLPNISWREGDTTPYVAKQYIPSSADDAIVCGKYAGSDVWRKTYSFASASNGTSVVTATMPEAYQQAWVSGGWIRGASIADTDTNIEYSYPIGYIDVTNNISFNANISGMDIRIIPIGFVSKPGILVVDYTKA